MDVIEAIEGRTSVRAFLDKPVSKEQIEKILNAARYAPSGVNTQPWQVTVVGKTYQQKISDAIINARESGIEPNPDYQYYPAQWFEPYKTRRKECGAALYGQLGIKQDDMATRKVQWYKNYYFFGAPVGLLFWIDKNLSQGSWMDLGMFIQNVMLAARGLGLETCAQASLSEYPDLVRSILNTKTPSPHQITDNYETKSLVCGMAIGYANWEDKVNQYRTSRLATNEFTNWLLD